MRWIVLLVGLWAGGALAQPRDVAIAAFYGRWVGSGLSETALSKTFRLTQRDFDVEVQPEGDGFRLSWTSILRQKGDPLAPNVVRREASMVFRPSGSTGKLWSSAENVDPLTGKPYAWARIERQTLVVTILDLDPAGKWEMQIYRRTLSDLGMKLDYSRLTEGEPVRTTQGRLTKFRN
jgi:hypothetical protein